MAELDEKLKSLPLDTGELKKVLEAAGALMGRDAPPHSAEPQRAAQPAPAPAPLSLPPSEGCETDGGEAPGLNQLLDALFSGSAPDGKAADSSAPAGEGPGSLSAVLPQLLQFFAGKHSYIDENRLNLVKALKPYMAETRADSVDRAIKMANMTKAAKRALGLLGR